MRDHLSFRRLVGAALAAWLVLFASATGAATGTGTRRDTGARPGTATAIRTAAAAAATTPAQAPSPQPSAYVPHEVLVGYRAGPIARVTSDFELRMGARASGPPPAPDSAVLHLPARESVPAAIAKLRHQPGVAYAEPNFIAREAGPWYPNDPGRAHQPAGWERMQWNLLPLVGIDAPQAWANLRADRRPGAAAS